MPVCFESLELENEALGSQKRHTENSKQSGQSSKTNNWDSEAYYPILEEKKIKSSQNKTKILEMNCVPRHILTKRASSV